MVWGRLEYEMRRHGARALANPPVVAGGARGNTIHYLANDRALGAHRAHSAHRAQTHCSAATEVLRAYSGSERSTGNTLVTQQSQQNQQSHQNQRSTSHSHSAAAAASDSGELLLVDRGAELQSMYVSDVTRTWPLARTFSAAQQTLYRAVLEVLFLLSYCPFPTFLLSYSSTCLFTAFAAKDSMH